MEVLLSILIVLIAVEHIGFLILEMFLWKKPIGLKVFKMTPQFAVDTATLAANQGLYNGFLAAGLFWALVHPSLEFRFSLKLFFLACIFVAGLYGWRSVGKTILYVQAIPAAMALVLLFCFKFNR